MVATPSSVQQELLQQADEIDFILRHFIEPACQGFKPSSNDELVYFQHKVLLLVNPAIASVFLITYVASRG